MNNAFNEKINLYNSQIERLDKALKRKTIYMGISAIGSYLTLLNLNNFESSTDTVLNAALLFTFGVEYISSSIDAMKSIAEKEICFEKINQIENEKTKKLILQKKEIDE